MFLNTSFLGCVKITLSCITDESCCFVHITGGVVCFNISFVEVNSYEDKLKELEDTGKWRLALKEKIPFVRDKLTEESILYIYEREGKATDLQVASSWSPL